MNDDNLTRSFCTSNCFLILIISKLLLTEQSRYENRKNIKYPVVKRVIQWGVNINSLHHPDRKEAIPLLNTFWKEMPRFLYVFLSIRKIFTCLPPHTKIFLIIQGIIINTYLLTVIFLPLIPQPKKSTFILITSVTILIVSHFSLVISFYFWQCAFDPLNDFLSVLTCFSISDDPVIMPKITILHLFSFHFPFNVENKPNDGGTIRLY